MNALAVPALLMGLFTAVVAFGAWLVFLSQSENGATPDQHSRAKRKNGTPA